MARSPTGQTCATRFASVARAAPARPRTSPSYPDEARPTLFGHAWSGLGCGLVVSPATSLCTRASPVVTWSSRAAVNAISTPGAARAGRRRADDRHQPPEATGAARGAAAEREPRRLDRLADRRTLGRAHPRHRREGAAGA